MKILKQIVGVDISMETFDVRFGVLKLQEDNNQIEQKYYSEAKFSNNMDGFKSFLKWADNQKQTDKVQIMFVMEATGVYYENLAYYLAEKNQNLAIILPNKTKSFSRTLEIKSKTDKIDATMLTQYGLEKELECWKIPSEMMKNLKILVREYHHLKSINADNKNRLHAHNHSYNPLPDVTNILNQQIEFFHNQIKSLEKKILKIVKKDKDFSEKIDRIDKIEGVGPMTIISILAETDCFALVENRKQLASYAGLDVTFRDSGLKKGKTSISKKGNKHLRNAVFMPALSAIKWNPKLKALYARLMAKGKLHKVAHVAVARKLLLLIYTIWKKNVEYVSVAVPQIQ